MTNWAEAAPIRLRERVDRKLDQVGERFPLYAAPDDGRWLSPLGAVL